MVALVRVGRGLQCLVRRDLEHGYDSLVGDLYFGDESFDGCLALAGGAAGHDLVEVGPEPFDRAGRRRRGLVIEFVGDLCVAGAELFDLDAKAPDPWTCGGVVHRAVLEGGVIPVDRRFGGLDLGLDGVEFGVPVGVSVVVLDAGAVDDPGEDGLGGGVEVVQRGQDRIVDVVGADAGGRAAGNAEPVMGVVPEDVAQDRRLGGVCDESLGVAVDEVAVGAATAGP